ncbi:alternative ribosome-rescue factor [Pseudomonas duriflava]|uniref:Alternative ribosome-rescue factor n=1 Tax=Pseudomonas duriflava TaxID=459528 RepID=A0A562QBV5_9PSED|nr:alternative ribosome rescue factor ArfA [Pseudomonas duriflava]TWI54245.1 alternative ribosome-rescue factor [Pseudomonas duriflava]
MRSSLRRPNKAKSLVCKPYLRCRQEKPKKGKGSYRREAFSVDNEKAFLFVAA